MPRLTPLSARNQAQSSGNITAHWCEIAGSFAKSVQGKYSQMKRLHSNGQDRGQVKRLVILLLCAVVITADTIGGQFLRSKSCQKVKEHMGQK